MNATTGIEWTDATSNPVKYRDKATGEIVWACVKRSPGCANCYAETLARRYGRGGPFTRDAMSKVEPFLCDKELRALLTSPKLAGKKVFVGDMTDVFGDWVTDDMLTKLFVYMAVRRDVTFQVLTKRVERMRDFIVGMDGREVNVEVPGRPMDKEPFVWPPRNVWLGVSVEDQKRALERIPKLLEIPAAVRFLSCEPLLGPLDLKPWVPCGDVMDQGNIRAADGWVILTEETDDELIYDHQTVDWVIAGGESGPDSRPCQIEWLTSLRDQCKAAGVPFFCKQLGSRPTTTLPPGESWPGHPGPSGPVQFSGDGFGNYLVLGLKNRKGGDMAEWPESLRVRDFPTTQREAQPCK